MTATFPAPAVTGGFAFAVTALAAGRIVPQFRAGVIISQVTAAVLEAEFRAGPVIPKVTAAGLEAEIAAAEVGT